MDDKKKWRSVWRRKFEGSVSWHIGQWEIGGITLTEKKQRSSNFELLRILLMLLIIAHHYVVNSGIAAADGPIFANPTSLHALYILLWGAWGKIGINCFVLLSGWFMCEKTISLRKFLKLLLEFMFYRIVIALVFWLTGYEKMTLNDVLDVLIPIRELSDGFAETYLVFFLFIPFLNILIRHLTERQHLRLLVLLCFSYVFFGTFRPLFSVTMNYISWFMVLFLTASYIRRYPKRFLEGTTRWGLIAGLLILLSALSVVACAFVSKRIEKTYYYVLVTDVNTLLAVCTGISVFLFFRSLRMKPNRVINAIAATVFGVFCIHANSDAMRRWLWQDTLKNVEYFDKPIGYLHIIGAVVGVFAVCALIDILRARVIERPFFTMLDRKLPGIVSRWQKFEDRLLEKWDKA